MANAPGCRRFRTSTAGLVAVVALMTLIAASCGGSTERGLGKEAATSTREPATASKDTNAIHTKQWLFAIQSSGPTTFDPTTNTLAMPTAAATAFTDRPYRDTRSTSPDVFANLWNSHSKNSFAKDPPNAVLTYWTDASGGGVPRTAVCKVTGDVRYRSADGVLSMGLSLLEPKGATLPTHLYRASLFVDNVPSTCTNSPEDEDIIEYFNEINFNDDIQVVINQPRPSDSFGITLTCPERISPTYPSAEFDLQMTTADGSATTTCDNQVPIQVNPNQAPAFCRNTQCTFMVTLLNSSTGTIYSQTELILNLTPEPNQTIYPELNAATLPICSQAGGQ
ncbi:MAG: hypothetical protein JWL73_702 [Actinomycetia bacterium]|nr:hypothetical protein [Actinomycetes bacterium]